jgi:WD40 repeat protein
VNGIVFLNDDRELITAGYDGRIARWSVDGSLLQSVDTGVPITHMVAHTSSDRMLTGHNDGTVKVWRLKDIAVIETRRLHTRAVRAVAIGGSEQYASSGVDGAVYLWRERAAEQRLADPPMDAWTLAFSPNGRWLMGGSWFRLFRWKLNDTSVSVVPTRHRGIIRSIAYLPGSNLLASISRQTDSAVYLLDPESGAVVRRLQQHDLCGASIALSPDGHYLATTSDDASVRIWDLAGGGDSTEAE